MEKAVKNNVYGEMSTADLARQMAYERNLKKARLTHEKQQHIQNSTKNSAPQRATAQKRTDAQKKQELKAQQRWHARMITARNRRKKLAKLAQKQKKIIKKYLRMPWLVITVAAVADAFFDLLIIPVVSTLLSFCTSLYINVALWRVGPQKERAKRRMIRAMVSLLDLIPIINLIPFSLLIVFKEKNDAEKRVRKAKGKLKEIEKAMRRA